MNRVLFIFGTRPEAIKLLPVIRQMRNQLPDFHPRICVTAQHRELLDQVLHPFSVVPDHDLNIMSSGQSLNQLTGRILSSLEAVLVEEKPDLVVVQGDTTSTFCGALAAFHNRIPVAHIEAGLRTGNRDAPFPEEMNRSVTTRIASLHFAPTRQARENLLLEGVPPESVSVTGNTGIDTLLFVTQALEVGILPSPSWNFPSQGRRLILVTAHRRESIGSGFSEICDALKYLSRREDVEIAFPVHPNPHVRSVFLEKLNGLPHLHLLPPLEYVPFVDLMRRAYFLITDSGGIQEEGPSLGKPILVLRNQTERPEGVETETVRLVGTTADRILKEAILLLDHPHEYSRRAYVHHTYGDGRASQRICHTIENFLTNDRVH